MKTVGIVSDGLSTRRKPIIERQSAMYGNAGWSENKAEQRQVIVDYARSVVGNRRRLRALTLPGETWAFEHLLTTHWPETHTVGFESSAITFERGIPYMTGAGRPTRYRWHFDVGYINVATRLFRSAHRSVFFNANVAALFRGHFHPTNWVATHNWRNYVNRFDLIWIDSTSPVGCDNSVAILQNIGSLLARTESVFALTFVVGRDDPELAGVINLCEGSSVERRATFAKEIAEKGGVKLRLDDVFQYHSTNASGSLTLGTAVFTGKSVLTNKARQAKIKESA